MGSLQFTRNRAAVFLAVARGPDAVRVFRRVAVSPAQCTAGEQFDLAACVGRGQPAAV